MHDLTAFSVPQPFAQLLVTHIKHYEVRTWRPNELGWYFVHASADISHAHRYYMANDCPWYLSALRKAGLDPHDPASWPTSAIVGAVNITKVYTDVPRLSKRQAQLAGAIDDACLWYCGKAVKLASPVSHGGALRLWTPTDAAIRRITSQIGSLR